MFDLSFRLAARSFCLFRASAWMHVAMKKASVRCLYSESHTKCQKYSRKARRPRWRGDILSIIASIAMASHSVGFPAFTLPERNYLRAQSGRKKMTQTLIYIYWRAWANKESTFSCVCVCVFSVDRSESDSVFQRFANLTTLAVCVCVCVGLQRVQLMKISMSMFMFWWLQAAPH